MIFSLAHTLVFYEFAFPIINFQFFHQIKKWTTYYKIINVLLVVLSYYILLAYSFYNVRIYRYSFTISLNILNIYILIKFFKNKIAFFTILPFFLKIL